jgi:hypothetical protein
MILAVFFLLLGTNLSAMTLSCEVSESNNVRNVTKDLLLIRLENVVISIDYVHKIPSPDGTFSDKIENLFGGSNRGGYTVSYCNPSENEYSRFNGRITVFALCTYGSSGRLLFDANFSTKENGSLEVAGSLGNDQVNRKVLVSTCKELE